jgi:hypothetical protein
MVKCSADIAFRRSFSFASSCWMAASFSQQQVHMTMKALCNVRPSRLQDPLPPRSRLVQGFAAVSLCAVERRSRGRRDVVPKVPAIRYTAQNTYTLVQYEA